MSYTVEQFKAQFPRFTPQFLSDIVYKNNTTYFKNNVVYYDGSFYICIVENTINDPSDTTDWKIYQDSVLNYTQDEDIQEAIQEASINFNKSLFGDCNKAKTAFGLLVAHYLTIDFNNATGVNNVGILKSTVAVKSHLGAENKLEGAVSINSESLTITAHDSSTTTLNDQANQAVAGLKIEMLWGEFK
jgi:hypothetical protein